VPITTRAAFFCALKENIKEFGMSNYQDNLTLDEIGENDLEMAKDAIKKAKQYNFGRNPKKAVLFIKNCMDVALKHLGIDVEIPKGKHAKKMYGNILDRKMKDAGVKIEHRNNYFGNDIWRNGLYIYKDDVLASFISDVLRVSKDISTKDKLRLKNLSTGFCVVTNARTDNFKRIYTPGKIKEVQMIVPSSKKNNAKLLHKDS
jgi:hypothetical protein